MRGPAAQWFESLNPALAWNDIRTQFIARFTDEKDKYRKRIEVENLRRQPEELIKIYIHRLTKTIEKGWPDPDFNEAFREGKSMEYFVRGLTPPALKQKAHQFLIENVGATWQQLRDHVSTKDLSFAVSSEFTGTSSNSMDNKLEIEGLKNQIRDLTSLMKDHKINATYNNNNPRMNQNQTRFCKYCRKSGHTIAYCYKRKENKEQNKQPPQTRDKFTDNYRQNRGRSPGQQSHYPNNKIEEEIIIQVKTTDNTLLIIGITLLIHPITLHQTDIGQVVTTLEIDKIREIHTGLIEIVAEIDQTVSRDTEIIQTNEAMIQIDKVTDLTVAITHEIIAESEVLKCTS